MEFIFALGFFLFGLLIGSFLNAVIHRLHTEESLNGRSYCPHCRKTIAWFDLIPVISFLILRGKCRHCKKPISVQYPFVELITGGVFLALYAFAFPNIPYLLFLLYIAASLLVIFVYDLKHYLIPDVVLVPAIVVAIAYRSIFDFHNLSSFLLAAVLACSFFFAIYTISKGVWMGFGDVKLAILLGFLTGFPGILVALFLAFLFGAIIGVISLALKKKGLKSEIPFAPFLIIGSFVALFWSNALIGWYVVLLVF